ncbi:MAG: hypothetical protein ABIF09_18700 [Gemmatimonadota bacterium]
MRLASLTLLTCTVLSSMTMPLLAQTFDVSVPPGDNFDSGEFRLWYPEGVEVLRGILVLVPGSNGDGRGNAFLEAVDRLADESGHPELSQAYFLLWGMSAGGQFNYEFALWKPERVLAFIVNKGGIYYSAQASAAAQQVPGFFFIGGADLEFRNDIIAGIFAINRRAGALWALAVEPGVSHEVAGSKAMAVLFFDEMIPLRLPSVSSGEVATQVPMPLDRDAGYIADPKSTEIMPAADAPQTTYPTSWLPTETLARAWQRLVGGKISPRPPAAPAPRLR